MLSQVDFSTTSFVSLDISIAFALLQNRLN